MRQTMYGWIIGLALLPCAAMADQAQEGAAPKGDASLYDVMERGKPDANEMAEIMALQRFAKASLAQSKEPSNPAVLREYTLSAEVAVRVFENGKMKDDAITLRTKVKDAWEKVCQVEPGKPEDKVNLAMAWARLALTQKMFGDVEQSSASATEALTQLDKLKASGALEPGAKDWPALMQKVKDMAEKK